MQQQHADQLAGRGGLPGSPAGRRPERLVGRGERPGRAGLVQGGRSGHGPRLAHQRLQVVAEHEPLAALGGQPRVPGDLSAAVEDSQLRRPQHHPDLAADQPGRYRVPVIADHDLPVAVNPRREHQAGLERIAGQRGQQRPLGFEVLPDRADPRPDPAAAETVAAVLLGAGWECSKCGAHLGAVPDDSLCEVCTVRSEGGQQ